MECKGIDLKGCKHNGSYNYDFESVCYYCDKEHRQKFKKENDAIDVAKKMARIAIYRAETGLKYGNDMKSSTKVCLQDALSLLQSALNEIEDIRV
jgi:hypothetical protein